MRVDNRNAVDNVAMVKETDIRIVNYEYHHQDATDQLTSPIYFQYHSTTNFSGTKITYFSLHRDNSG
jgi:hypothetical protein